MTVFTGTTVYHQQTMKSIIHQKFPFPFWETFLTSARLLLYHLKALISSVISVNKFTSSDAIRLFLLLPLTAKYLQVPLKSFTFSSTHTFYPTERKSAAPLQSYENLPPDRQYPLPRPPTLAAGSHNRLSRLHCASHLYLHNFSSSANTSTQVNQNWNTTLITIHRRNT